MDHHFHKYKVQSRESFDLPCNVVPQLRHITDQPIISLQFVSRYCHSCDSKLCGEILYLIQPIVRYGLLSSLCMQNSPIVIYRQITEVSSNEINKALVQKQYIMCDGEQMNVHVKESLGELSILTNKLKTRAEAKCVNIQQVFHNY